jgi:hypothetical protein
MDFQDRLTPAHIRLVEDNSPVETAGSKESRIEDIWPIRRRHDDYIRIRIEAVHLDEHLIERLFPLIMAAAEAGAALTAYSVDLINKDDAGGVALCLIEKIAHSTCANADEHFDELRARNREEGYTRFP